MKILLIPNQKCLKPGSILACKKFCQIIKHKKQIFKDFHLREAIDFRN